MTIASDPGGVQAATLRVKVANSGASVAGGDPNCRYVWKLETLSGVQVAYFDYASPASLNSCEADVFVLNIPDKEDYDFSVSFGGHGSYNLELNGIPIAGAFQVPFDNQIFSTWEINNLIPAQPNTI